MYPHITFYGWSTPWGVCIGWPAPWSYLPDSMGPMDESWLTSPVTV